MDIFECFYKILEKDEPEESSAVRSFRILERWSSFFQSESFNMDSSEYFCFDCLKRMMQ